MNLKFMGNLAMKGPPWLQEQMFATVSGTRTRTTKSSSGLSSN